MTVLLAAVCGFVLDLALGDPAWMPHPVVFMGRCIARLEKVLRRVFPATPKGELAAGCVLAAMLPLGTLAVTGLVVWLCGRVHPALGFAVQAFWCWQALAMRCLAKESRNVYHCLKTQGLEAGRKAVSRISCNNSGSSTFNSKAVSAGVRILISNDFCNISRTCCLSGFFCFSNSS